LGVSAKAGVWLHTLRVHNTETLVKVSVCSPPLRRGVITAPCVPQSSKGCKDESVAADAVEADKECEQQRACKEEVKKD